MPSTSRIGRTILQARRAARLSGPELARASGVGESWIRQLETGRIDRPGPDKLAAIAKTLGLDVRQLLAMSDQLTVSIEASPPPWEQLLANQETMILNQRAMLGAIARLAMNPVDAETRSEIREGVVDFVRLATAEGLLEELGSTRDGRDPAPSDVGAESGADGSARHTPARR